MTSDHIMSYIREILDREGWKYEISGEELLLLAAYGGRKWKLVLSSAGEGQLCCYAVYPWTIPEKLLNQALVSLNELNFLQRRGCFMLNTADHSVLYRCSTRILDEYCGAEYAADVLLCCIAAANANWDRILGIAGIAGING